MCAISDKATTARYRKSTKPIVAWKIVKKEGARPDCFYYGFRYVPGINKAKQGRKSLPIKYEYKEERTTAYGIHAFLSKKTAKSYNAKSVVSAVVPVCINPKDILTVEGKSRFFSDCPQIVAREVYVDQKAWKPV